jgi:hypothetical protein
MSKAPSSGKLPATLTHNDRKEPSMKVVFTSCMDATRVPLQSVWDKILEEKPSVLMLLGDQIYMDWGLTRSKDPKWLRRINDKGLKALGEFGRDMHARYAAQWSVASFRNLIRWFVPTHGKDQFFMCWDDHDFAWNNACGMGLPQNAAVPPAVKALSRALFKQFFDHLCTGYASDPYPSYPDKLHEQPPLAQAGIEYFSPTPIHTVRIAVLDERWYRYPREEITAMGEFPSLLGGSQWAELEKMLAESTGLSIIAGGLPMRHNYRFSHQSWGPGKKGEAAYPDYDRMLRTVKKPTIFLAGDIHKNEWVGTMADTNSKVNPHLIHVASSGAAIDNVFFVKFEPAYGVLDIDSSASQVKIRLASLVKKVWKDEFSTHLSYSKAGWQAIGGPMQDDQTQDAHATHYLAKVVAQEASVPELGLLCARARNKNYRYASGPFTWDEMDDIYSDDDLSNSPGSEIGSAYPEVVKINASRRNIVAWNSVSSQTQNAVSSLMQDALARAQAGGKKSIVLFVHGFNNGFAESVDQAYALRALYPDVEPVLLSWPGGVTSSILLDGGHDAALAFHNAQHLGSTLVTALKEMAALNTGNIKRILACRSYGAVALQNLVSNRTLWTANDNHQVLDTIDSIVLSAPATPFDELEKWAGDVKPNVNVIVNRNDTALTLGYQLIHKTWAALGAHFPQGHVYSNFSYFDCTDFTGVNNRHNIITTVVNNDVLDLHRLLLTGQLDTTSPPSYLKTAPGKHKIWTKS